MMVYPALLQFIKQAQKNFSKLSKERKIALTLVARYIEQHDPASLIFVCTHNSRRSHIAQLWAQTLAAHFDFKNVRSYSGGTETTAFNPRAVQAMRSVGFRIDEVVSGENPHYHVFFSDDEEAITVYSKIYNDAANPQTNFCAVMTCSHADENCPFIPGTKARIALTYDDPKDFDNTPQESEKYAERVTQIGTELLYAFLLVGK